MGLYEDFFLRGDVKKVIVLGSMYHNVGDLFLPQVVMVQPLSLFWGENCFYLKSPDKKK